MAGQQGKRTGVRVRHLVGWGVLGQLSYVISQFLLLFFLTRFASVEDVGRFGLASALILPVYWFFSFGVRINQATDVHSEYRFKEFLAIRCVATALGYMVILGIGMFAVDAETRMVLMVFGLAKGVETFSELCYGTFQKNDRLELQARSLALRGFGGAAVFGILMATNGALPIAYSGLLLVWALVSFGLDLPRAMKLARAGGDDWTLQPRRCLRLVVQNLPLAVNGLFSGLQASTPRLVVAKFLGLAAVGQYTVVAYAMQAVMTMTTALAQSLVARLAQHVANGNRRAYGRLLVQFILLVVSATSGAALASVWIGDWVLGTVFGAEYGMLGTLLALCLLAAGSSATATFLQFALLAARRFRTNMYLRLFAFAAMVVGVTGGALTLGLNGVVLGLLGATFLHATALALVLLRLPFTRPPPAAEAEVPQAPGGGLP